MFRVLNRNLKTPSPFMRCFTSTRWSALDEVMKFDPSIQVESAVTPPSSWFQLPSFYKLDLGAIFKKNWICVGRSDQIKRPGQYFSGEIGDESFVVVRDDEYGLRAFHNVCRHHAAQLTQSFSEGCTAKFVCPYHGWTYALDGRLLKATRLKGIVDFKARNYGLKPMAVTEWGPLVFVHLDSMRKGQELHEKLKTIEIDLESRNKGIQFVKRVTYDMKCNWKVFVDNYLDGGYHVEHLHGDLTAKLDIKSYHTTVNEWYSIQKVRGKGDDTRIGEADALYIFIYPNIMMNRYGPWLDTNLILPTGPKSCKVIFDYYLDENFSEDMSASKLDEFIESSLRDSDQVQQEDNMICESVQRGLASSVYDVGRYAPQVEKADHEFHKKLAMDYKNYFKDHENQ